MYIYIPGLLLSRGLASEDAPDSIDGINDDIFPEQITHFITSRYEQQTSRDMFRYDVYHTSRERVEI